MTDDTSKKSEDAALESLSDQLRQMELQIERGAIRTHSLLGRFAERVNRVESLLYGLADSLLDSGAVSEESLRTDGSQSGVDRRAHGGAEAASSAGADASCQASGCRGHGGRGRAETMIAAPRAAPRLRPADAPSSPGAGERRHAPFAGSPSSRTPSGTRTGRMGSPG